MKTNTEERRRQLDAGMIILFVLGLLSVLLIRLAYERARTADMVMICLPLNMSHILAVAFLFLGLSWAAVMVISLGLVYSSWRALIVYREDPARTKRERRTRVKRVLRALIPSLSAIIIAGWVGFFLWGDLYSAPAALFLSLLIIVTLWWRVLRAELKLRNENGQSSALDSS